MEDKLSIRVSIAERFYPLKIERSDEEKIRKAAKMINERIAQYQQRYADKDTQDILAMAALQFVIRMLDSETKVDNSSLIEEIASLDKEIEAYLNKEEQRKHTIFEKILARTALLTLCETQQLLHWSLLG